jgi:hypothetical protein
MRGAVGQIAMADSAGEFLFELPDRDVELQVSLADRSRPRLVPVPASQQRVSVELDTPPTCTLAARVQSLIGRKRMPGVLLRITPLDGGGDEAAVQSRWLDTPNGDLRWELCPAGRVRLEVRADDCAPLVVERDLAANEVHQLGDVLLEPGALLTGRVVDDRGAPVADAVVWLGEEGDLELFEPGVHTDGNGSFVIGGVTHLSSRVVARATGFAPTAIDLDLPDDVLSSQPRGITRERGTTIEVEVRGAPFEGGLVELRRDGRLVATAEADESGRAFFWNRSAGAYTVRLVGGIGSALPVTVAPGAGSVRVRLAQ